MVPPMVGSEADTQERRWQRLFMIAGVAAACTAVLIVVQIVVYAVWPPPATAIEHLALMRDRPLLGLLSLDLLYVIDNVLLIPILLALFVALRRFDESVMAIGATLGFVGVAALFASNPAANMHYLAARSAASCCGAGRSAGRRRCSGSWPTCSPSASTSPAWGSTFCCSRRSSCWGGTS